MARGKAPLGVEAAARMDARTNAFIREPWRRRIQSRHITAPGNATRKRIGGRRRRLLALTMARKVASACTSASPASCRRRLGQAAAQAPITQCTRGCVRVAFLLAGSLQLRSIGSWVGDERVRTFARNLLTYISLALPYAPFVLRSSGQISAVQGGMEASDVMIVLRVVWAQFLQKPAKAYVLQSEVRTEVGMCVCVEDVQP